jgi:hypothetical protein
MLGPFVVTFLIKYPFPQGHVSSMIPDSQIKITSKDKIKFVIVVHFRNRMQDSKLRKRKPHPNKCKVNNNEENIYTKVVQHYYELWYFKDT